MSPPLHHLWYRRLSELILLQSPVTSSSCFCTSFSAAPFHIAFLKLFVACQAKILANYFPCLAARFFKREHCSIRVLAPLLGGCLAIISRSLSSFSLHWQNFNHISLSLSQRSSLRESLSEVVILWLSYKPVDPINAYCSLSDCQISWNCFTACCIWIEVSPFSKLNRLSSSLRLFCHVALDQLERDWRMRLNDTLNAIGCTYRSEQTHKILCAGWDASGSESSLKITRYWIYNSTYLSRCFSPDPSQYDQLEMVCTSKLPAPKRYLRARPYLNPLFKCFCYELMYICIHTHIYIYTYMYIYI